MTSAGGTDKYTEEIVYQWQKTWSEKDLRELVDSCEKNTVELPYFLKYLPKNELTIECGCGLGQWMVYLNRKGFKMAGVEIVPDCIDICKKYFPGTDISVGDVRNIPCPDNHYGGYISIGVLEHMIEGPEQVIVEMRRVLKPGGVVIITVPAFNYVMRLWYPIRRFLVNVLRSNAFIRKLLGKPELVAAAGELNAGLNEMKKLFHPGFWPSVGVDPAKGPLFIEYKCKKGLIDWMLRSCGFEIVEAVPVFHPYIFHDVFGDYFYKKGRGDISNPDNMELNLAGRLAHFVFNSISPHFFNYVYLYVARKL